MGRTAHGGSPVPGENARPKLHGPKPRGPAQAHSARQRCHGGEGAEEVSPGSLPRTHWDAAGPYPPLPTHTPLSRVSSCVCPRPRSRPHGSPHRHPPPTLPPSSRSVKIAPGAVVCVESEIRGDVTIGKGPPPPHYHLHPYTHRPPLGGGCRGGRDRPRGDRGLFLIRAQDGDPPQGQDHRRSGTHCHRGRQLDRRTGAHHKRVNWKLDFWGGGLFPSTALG